MSTLVICNHIKRVHDTECPNRDQVSLTFDIVCSPGPANPFGAPATSQPPQPGGPPAANPFGTPAGAPAGYPPQHPPPAYSNFAQQPPAASGFPPQQPPPANTYGQMPNGAGTGGSGWGAQQPGGFGQAAPGGGFGAAPPQQFGKPAGGGFGAGWGAPQQQQQPVHNPFMVSLHSLKVYHIQIS